MACHALQFWLYFLANVSCDCNVSSLWYDSSIRKSTVTYFTLGCRWLQWVRTGSDGLKLMQQLWAGVGCNGLQWVAMGYSGLSHTKPPWVAMGWVGLQWAAMDYSGLSHTKPPWVAMGWSGLMFMVTCLFYIPGHSLEYPTPRVCSLESDKWIHPDLVHCHTICDGNQYREREMHGHGQGLLPYHYISD